MWAPVSTPTAHCQQAASSGYEKPIIYYTLTVLMAAGIRDFCLIFDPASRPAFKNLLDSSDYLGINIDYREQAKPEGITRPFLIAADFVGTDKVTLILGDNIFSGGDNFLRATASFKAGTTYFSNHVTDPQLYGVAQFTPHSKVRSLEEKPAKRKSNFAVPGAYIYDRQVVDIAKSIKPPGRNELEIIDVNLEYLCRNRLIVHPLSRGFAWLDAGTCTALQEASAYIEAIEHRQGVKIGCPEEAALVPAFITLQQFQVVVLARSNCEYRDYLNLVAYEFTESN